MLSNPVAQAVVDQVHPKVWRAIERLVTPGVVEQMSRLGDYWRLASINGFTSQTFAVNAMIYRAGMKPEHVDRFLLYAVKNTSIPMLRVVHPLLDGEGIIQDMVRERFSVTDNQPLRDACTNAFFVERMREEMDAMSPGRMLPWLQRIASIHVPMAITLGKDRDEAISVMEGTISDGVARMSKSLPSTCGVYQGLMDHFLIGYPDLWPRYGITASHFLGAPMIRDVRGDDLSAASNASQTHPVLRRDPMVYRGPAGKSMVRVASNRYPESLTAFVLEYLAKIDPQILSADNLLLDGTRSRPWVRLVKGVESRMDLIELLIEHGIDHPAFARIDGLAGKLSEKGAKSAMTAYLRDGGTAKRKMAAQLVECNPGLFEWGFEQSSGHLPMLRRLSNLGEISSEKIGGFTPLVKRKLLNHQLGL